MRTVRALVLVACFMPLAHALPLGPAPPFADFVYTNVLPRENVTFTSTSTSPSSVIVLHEWAFDDAPPGLLPTTGAQIDHVFARPGSYWATLTVTDALLGTSSISRQIEVPHTPPTAAMNVTPSPVFRGDEVRLSDRSFDEDGDEIVNWTWVVGDRIYGARNVTLRFAELGLESVQLTVRDAAGHEASVATQVRVLNKPPVVDAIFTPHAPRAGEPVAFYAAGVDPDTNEPLEFHWAFADGQMVGDAVTRAFPAGNHTVSMRGRDVDGGLSAPWTALLHVES